MTPKEEKENEFTKDKVEEFAKELMMWAGRDKEREILVKWLLTRTVSHQFEGTGGKFVIERRPIGDFDIVEAVKHALAHCKPNPGFSTTGWVRGGPTWPRGYAPGWLKAYGC